MGRRYNKSGNDSEVVHIMIPILYAPNAESFDNDGIGTLTDTISCTVTEERNGTFELELTYPVAGILYDEIKPDSFSESIA